MLGLALSSPALYYNFVSSFRPFLAVSLCSLFVTGIPVTNNVFRLFSRALSRSLSRRVSLTCRLLNFFFFLSFSPFLVVRHIFKKRLAMVLIVLKMFAFYANTSLKCSTLAMQIPGKKCGFQQCDLWRVDLHEKLYDGTNVQ